MNPRSTQWPIYTIGLLPILFIYSLTISRTNSTAGNISPSIGSNDSLVLVDLFNSTNGPNWKTTTNWLIPNQKIGLWFGIEAGLDDVVITIKLDEEGIVPVANCVNFNTPGNGLQGSLPPNFCLPSATCIALPKNRLKGAIPDFSCSTVLTNLNLSHNFFTGPIPLSLLQVNTLEGIYFQSNLLSGTIPLNMPEILTNLQVLNISANDLEGLVPDFSTLDNLIGFDINGNAFTFEDILPHYEAIEQKVGNGFQLHGQDSIYYDTLFNVAIGYPFTIDLMIDDTVTTSSYKWTHNGNDFDSIFINQLFFPEINNSHNGDYYCKITNSQIPPFLPEGVEGPYLSLYSEKISISTCTAGITNISRNSWCRDSVYHIEYAALNIDTTFSVNNPEGWVRLDDAAFNGCDSIIEVNLNYLPEGNVIETICDGACYPIVIADTCVAIAGIHQFTIPNVGFKECDSVLILNLTIADTMTFGTAEAGTQQIICTNEAILQATPPNSTEGTWTILSPSSAELLDPNDPNSLVFQLPPGETLLQWSLQHEDCPPFSSDIVSIYYQPMLQLKSDQFEVEEGSRFDGNVILNDSLDFTLDWTAALIQAPNSGTLDFQTDGTFTFNSEINRYGQDSFLYTIINPNCPSTNTVVVYLNLGIKKDVSAIPNVITPNNDGLNDFFIIPCIDEQTQACLNNKILIFNRWGGEVFVMDNYDNSWDGEGLPQNTYYYFFYFGEQLDQKRKGAVAIVYDQR